MYARFTRGPYPREWGVIEHSYLGTDGVYHFWVRFNDDMMIMTQQQPSVEVVETLGPADCAF